MTGRVEIAKKTLHVADAASQCRVNTCVPRRAEGTYMRRSVKHEIA